MIVARHVLVVVVVTVIIVIATLFFTVLVTVLLVTVLLVTVLLALLLTVLLTVLLLLRHHFLLANHLVVVLLFCFDLHFQLCRSQGINNKCRSRLVLPLFFVIRPIPVTLRDELVASPAKRSGFVAHFACDFESI